MSIPEHVIEEIKNRCSITEVAAEFVQLKRSGTNQVALCPFHSEKTPSFHVREEQGTFHCFGCGKHGNIFTLLMELRGMTFPESVRYFARRLGIEIPEDSRGHGREQDEQLRRNRALCRAVCSKATAVFQNTLAARGAPMEYLRERGIVPSSIETFRLGFAPDSRQFILPALKEDTDRGELSDEALPALLEQVGLTKKKEGSSTDVYDVFRNRIIFPIARSDGASIAFGGRIMPNTDSSRAPKYLNSCENVLYSKRQTLYGIPQAMKEMRTKRHAFVVEGYMDVLGMHQAGLADVVATCGTAVSEHHAALLRRFVERVTIVFDGDSAGVKAAASCFEAFLNSGLDCFAVLIPEGEDPDTLARKLSSAQLSDYLEANKRSLFEVYLEQLIGDSGVTEGGLSPTGSGKIAQKLAQVLARVKNSVEREFLLRRGAERLGATASSIESLLTESLRNAPPPRVQMRQPTPSAVVSRAKSDPRAGARSAERRAAQPPRAPSAAPAPKKIQKFYQQLLIAAVCDPVLAADFLRVAALNEPERGVKMPQKLRCFLLALEKRVSSGSQAGMSSGDDAAWDTSGQSSLSEAELGTLLEEHGFEAARVLAAAREQSGRGCSPQAVFDSAGDVSARQSLEQEIVVLRNQEEERQDAEYLLKIAQEKLEKRRSLERMQKRSA